MQRSWWSSPTRGRAEVVDVLGNQPGLPFRLNYIGYVGVRAKQSAAYYKSVARNHDLMVAVVGPVKRF